MPHVLDYHLRPNKARHEELVIIIYVCIERLAVEYTLRRHEVFVSLKEKLSVMTLDLLLDTHGGEKEIVIRCCRIVH